MSLGKLSAKENIHHAKKIAVHNFVMTKTNNFMD